MTDELSSAVLDASEELDMSLPPEEAMPEGSIVASPTDFITGPGVDQANWSESAELEVDRPPPPAPVAEAADDPFAAFGPSPASPAAPARAPAAPAQAPRPAGKPPWQK